MLSQKSTGPQSSIKGKIAVFFLTAVGLIPLTLSQSIGKCIGLLAYYLNTREVKIARRNIQLCFSHLSSSEQQQLLKQSLLHFGMQAFEIAYLWLGSSNRGLQLIKSVEGEDVFKQAIASDKGLLLVLPHLGNWEVVNAYILKHIPGIAMYSPAQLPEVDRIMRRGREKTGLELAEANKRGVIFLMKRLIAGGNLFILPDQEPERSGGEFAPFFGHQTLTMTLISKMLNKSQAVPVLAYAERLGAGKGFKIVFRSIDPAISDSDLSVSLTALNQAVEKSIQEAPAQYMWGYKRFKKRPEGEEKLYNELS